MKSTHQRTQLTTGRRTVWWCLVLGLTFHLQAFSAARKTPEQPNILYILADQWRGQAFGFAGDPNVKTPNVDQLAAESVQFVNAVAGMPVCCPTRSSLMTGQRPLTHGVFMNDVSLSPRATSLAKVLKAAGYDTGYIGKWHMDGHGRSNSIPPERRQGFDYWKVLECTHNYSNSFYYADSPEKQKWDGYDVFAQTADAQAYLRERAQSKKPFVLFVAWGPPHDPYQVVPGKYRDMYDPAKLVLRPNVPAEKEQLTRRNLAGYYAHCTALDECVGQLRQALKAAGLEHNTLLVFNSDHGDMLGSQGSANKQQPFEESIRVPLLFHWPAGLGTAGRKFDAPINSEDLMPTLLGLVNVRIPRTVEGLDYSKYIQGGKNPSDGATLLSCVAPFGQWHRGKGGREFRGVRTVQYTFVRDLKGPWLLFDDAADPYQRTNLVGKAEAAGLQKELERLLQRKLKAAKDKFLPAENYIREWGYKVDETGTVPFTN